MDKLHSYQGWGGRFHEWRDNIRSNYSNWKEEHEGEGLVDLTKNYVSKISVNNPTTDGNDYSHVYRLVLCFFNKLPAFSLHLVQLTYDRLDSLLIYCNDRITKNI